MSAPNLANGTLCSIYMESSRASDRASFYTRPILDQTTPGGTACGLFVLGTFSSLSVPSRFSLFCLAPLKNWAAPRASLSARGPSQPWGPTGSATSRCCRARTTVATPKPCLNGSAGAGNGALDVADCRPVECGWRAFLASRSGKSFVVRSRFYDD